MNKVKRFPLDKQMPDMVLRFNKKIQENEVNLKIFTKTVELYLNNWLEEAVFMSEKLKTMLNEDPLAIYLLAECYFTDLNFVKVNYLFQKNDLINLDENFVILSAKSWIASKNYE